MPKKNMTEAERAAWGAKMKAARAKAAEAKQGLKEVPDQLKSKEETTVDLTETVLQLQAQVAELLKGNRLETAAELKSKQESSETRETPKLSDMGNLVGSFERYITDPSFYPDPRERLAAEPRLVRFAFPQNFELDFKVSTTQYETIDHTRVKEPRFTIELIRIMLDEDTGEDTGNRFVITRGIFHEDPEAAIEIAGRNNVVVDEMNQKSFLDEMRYLRMRDWLLEAFYPPKADPKTNKRQMVIGNKLVDVYTKSHEVGEESAPIPFSTLSKL